MPIERHKGLAGPGLEFITTTCIGWLPVFKNESIAEMITLQLGETTQIMGVSVVAYVVMLSHVHAMLGFEDIAAMPDFMRNFKGLSSKRIKPLNLCVSGEPLNKDGEFRLWKRRYDDVHIHTKDQFWTKLQYIHNNPVKAELAKAATDWKFSSARDWMLGEKGLIEVDKGWRPLRSWLPTI